MTVQFVAFLYGRYLNDSTLMLAGDGTFRSG